MTHTVGNSPAVRGLRGGRAGQHPGDLPFGGAAQGPHAADRSRRGVVQSGDDRGAGLPAAEPRKRGLPPLAAPTRRARDPARGNRRRGAGLLIGGASARVRNPEPFPQTHIHTSGRCLPLRRRRPFCLASPLWGCLHRGSRLAPVRRSQGVFPRRRRSAAHLEMCSNNKNVPKQQLQKMPIRQKCAILTNSAHRSVRSLGFLDFFTYL